MLSVSGTGYTRGTFLGNPTFTFRATVPLYLSMVVSGTGMTATSLNCQVREKNSG